MEVYKIKVLIASIHHRNPQRTAYQARNVSLLKAGLEALGWEVLSIESSWQDGVSDYVESGFDIFLTLWRREALLARERARRRGEEYSFTWQKKFRLFKKVRAQIGSTKKRPQLVSLLHTQRAVTRKHAHVWLSFVNSDADRLIVVEDDFVFDGDSSLRRLVVLLEAKGDDFDFIDLAGGIPPEKLGIVGNEADDIEVEFVLTNTTCAYTLNQRLAGALVAMISNDLKKVNLGTDFLPLALNETGFRGRSLLPSELPFSHGSLTGVVRSSIPY